MSARNGKREVTVHMLSNSGQNCQCPSGRPPKHVGTKIGSAYLRGTFEPALPCRACVRERAGPSGSASAVRILAGLAVTRKGYVQKGEKVIAICTQFTVCCEGRPTPAMSLRQTRFRLEKQVADTKLDRTSLSADVFLTFCRWDIAGAGLVTTRAYTIREPPLIRTLPYVMYYNLITAYRYFLRTSALSVASQGREISSRPKWP